MKDVIGNLEESLGFINEAESSNQIIWVQNRLEDIANDIEQLIIELEEM